MAAGKVILVVCGLGVFAAAAAPAANREEVWPSYWRTLNRVCPAKHLELLAPSQLHDELDAFKAGVRPSLRAKLDRNERHRCKAAGTSEGCANFVDLGLLEKHRLLPPLSAALCQRFASCQNQSECRLAAPPH